MQCRCGYTYCFTCLRVHKQHTHEDWLRYEKQEKIDSIFRAKSRKYKQEQGERERAQREKEYEIAARSPHTLWIYNERKKWEEQRNMSMFKPMPVPEKREASDSVKQGYDSEVSKKKKALQNLHSPGKEWRPGLRSSILLRESYISVVMEDELTDVRPKKKKKKGKKGKKGKPQKKYWDVSAFELWLGKFYTGKRRGEGQQE